MPKLPVIIGRRLRARRALLGLTQPEVAERTGIPQAHISRYERGAFASINPERIVMLARVLGVSTDWLLGLTDEDEEERPTAAGSQKARSGRRPAGVGG